MTDVVAQNLIRSGVVLVGAVIAYVLLARLGRRLASQYQEKAEKEKADRIETLWVVLRRVVMIVVAVTTIFILFGGWGISMAPFIAVGTVLAAAVGFGAQDLVKDVIAGFFMLIEDQFTVGDVVTIAGVTGTVEDIQLRVTVMRDLNGNQLYVPNGQVTVTTNFTSAYANPVIDVGIAYESDVDRALAVLEDELTALGNDPEWSSRIFEEPLIMGVNELGDSSVVLRARLTTDADERWTVRREALRRVKKRFDAEGINIPFPQVTIHRAD